MQVLVVEDSSDGLLLLQSMLERCGHAVRCARTAAEAEQIIADWRPDAILLDIGLPGMDGYELARHLRQKGLSTARIVAISGYPEVPAMRQEAGIDCYLLKPASLRQILASILGECNAAN